MASAQPEAPASVTASGPKLEDWPTYVLLVGISLVLGQVVLHYMPQVEKRIHLLLWKASKRPVHGKLKVHGPSRWPVIGNLLDIHRNRSRIYDFVLEMHKEHGRTFNMDMEMLGNVLTFTSDPVNVEHILKTNFTNYPKGADFQAKMKELLGQGIFNSDGHMWRIQRKAASLEFSQRSLRDLMLTTFNSQVQQRLMPVLEASCKSQQPLDLQDVFSRYTLDSICKVAFGVDLGTLAPDFPKVPFAAAFDTATEITCQRFLRAPVQWQCERALCLGKERALLRARRDIDTFAYNVIRHRRKELEEDKGVHRTDLLSRFMQLATEDGGSYSDEFVRDTVLNFVLAGRDTTAITISWFFHLIMHHPHVEKAILSELERLKRQRQAEVFEVSGWAFEELKQMHYLQAALSETLRLYPAVPNEFKSVSADDVLPDGTFVPGGSHVCFCPYAMGRMESIWGADAAVFRPERWLAADGTFTQESSFKFTAFQGGPRICLGKDMAYTQLKAIVASTLPHYQFRPATGHPVEYRVSLTLFMKHGLPCEVSKRDPVVPAQAGP